MVREEYLNPEFMYKFINSLCKADGWIMYHFVFGKLVFKNFNQPILLKNNHGYNMVYRFRMYKLREDAEYGKFNKMWCEPYFCVSSRALDKCFIMKTVYFDILNECFVEHDNNVSSFEKFPPFFRLDNQIYYGIYEQPRVLKYHYSRARDCVDSMKYGSDFERYMELMDISMKNFFDPYSLLCNSIDKDKRHFNSYDREEHFHFKTKEEAAAAITDAFNRDYGCPKEYEKSVKADIYCKDEDVDLLKDYMVKIVTRYCVYTRLPIHEQKVPLFYTDNVLELTVPIAESVKTLASACRNGFLNLQNMVSLVAGSTQMLMNQHLSDLYWRKYREISGILLRENAAFITNIDGIRAITNKAADMAYDAIATARRFYDGEAAELSSGLYEQSRLVSSSMSKMDGVYERMNSLINNITPANFSLTTLLDISNNFKMIGK